MSQLIHHTAHLFSRPLRVTCRTRPLLLTTLASSLLSFNTSSHTAASSSHSSSSPLAQTFRRTLIQSAAALSPPRDSTKGREGFSITEEDDYQQQPSDPAKQSQQPTAPPTQPRTTNSTTATTAATAANPASTASASTASASPPTGAHAYFRVPTSFSPYSSTAQAAHGGGAAGVLHAGQPLVDMATDLTEQFMRAVHLSEQTRFTKGVVLGISLLALLSLVGYLFRDSVKTTTAEQVADVAKRSLADSDVKDQVNTLSQDVVHRLLTDQAVLSTALQFTQRLLHEPGTQTALANLLQRLLADPKTLDWGKEFSSRLVAQLTADEKVQRQVAELVKGALMQENNREMLINLLKQTVNDERSMSELRRVGAQSAKDVMNDDGVQKHMTEFMKGVLADSSLQQQAGDALWSAVRYSIRPTWGKANGGNHDKDKQQGVKVAGVESVHPGLSRPLSAPLTAETDVEALASAADGLRDAVLLKRTKPAGSADGRAHSSDSYSSGSPSPLDPHSASPVAASSPSSPSSPSSSATPSHPSAPSSYLPAVHAPFAVASVDEEDLTPTFTINVNPQRAQPA